MVRCNQAAPQVTFIVERKLRWLCGGFVVGGCVFLQKYSDGEVEIGLTCFKRRYLRANDGPTTRYGPRGRTLLVLA
jgi:hypothetical protein